jgi:hypothetical protein
MRTGPLADALIEHLVGDRARLVSWSGDPVAVAADPVDDLVGCLGPAERAGLFVPDLDTFLQGCLERVD